MLKLKDLILITFNTLLLLFIVAEIFLRLNQEYLIRLNSYLPNTETTIYLREIIKKKNESLKSKFIFNNKSYNLYTSKIKKKIHNSDLKYGASDIFFFNKQGFKNEHTDTYAKIIAFGDSFTFGSAVKPHQVWIKNIFKKTNINEIYNYGLSGTGPYDYTNLLIEKANVNTELIIYSIYEGNDFLNILRDLKIIDINNTKSNNQISNVTKNNKKIFISLKKYLGKLYTFNFTWAYLKKQLAPNQNDIIDFRYKKMSKDKLINFNLGNSDTDEVKSANYLTQGTKKNFYQSVLKDSLIENFLNSKNYAEKYNSKIIFLYIPSAYSAFGKENTIFNDKKIKNLVFEYSFIFEKIFKDICIDYEFNCLSTINALKIFNKESDIPSHFPHNLHLTPAGNLIVSSELKKYICGKNFLKSDYINQQCS
jgi:hypothetical protein